MINPTTKRELCNFNDASFSFFFFLKLISKSFSNQTNKLELLLSALNTDDTNKRLFLKVQTIIALSGNYKIYLNNFSQIP